MGLLKTASDKIFHNKLFDIANNSQCYEYQRGLGSIVHTFFHEKN